MLETAEFFEMLSDRKNELRPDVLQTQVFRDCLFLRLEQKKASYKQNTCFAREVALKMQVNSLNSLIIYVHAKPGVLIKFFGFPYYIL